MKKLLVLFSFLLIAGFSSRAQTATVGDLTVEQIRERAKYVTVTASIKLGQGWKIQIHWGQSYDVADSFTDQDVVLKNAQGEKMVFNNLADILNFMYAIGYEYIDRTDSSILFKRIE